MPLTARNPGLAPVLVPVPPLPEPQAPPRARSAARSRRPRHLHAVEAASRPVPPPGTDAEMPPPAEAAVQRLALFAFEAVEGSRAIAGLGRLISPEVIAELRLQRRARTEQRSLHGDTRRIVPTPGPAHLSRTADRVVDGVVVLRAVPRSIAVAFRFEWTAERWQATQLTVL